MSCWFLVVTLTLIQYWSSENTAAAELPVLVDGDDSSGRQVIYIPPRAYLLCWKGVCDPRLWAEMAKRTPYYNFGLGKRSDSKVDETTAYPDEYAENDDTKRAAPTRYNFGIGKKSESSHKFNFGLGKRQSHRFSFGLGKREAGDMRNRFAFGLGKRDVEETESEDEDQMDDEFEKRGKYNFGLGKKASPYSFGLGKRSARYDFGLGKRGKYQFGLGKRERMLYNFGLGKREVDPSDVNNDYQTEVQDMNEEEMDYDRDEKRARPYAFGLGKRSIKRSRPYAFGLGKRSVPTTTPLTGNEAAVENKDKDTSRTTPTPTPGKKI
ncbi:hypothetical protein CHUAL_003362 [Chamberlinius hualienensis]